MAVIGHFDGALTERTFFNVFHDLYARGATGLLSARRGSHNKDVFLEKGQPIFVASNVEHERFGDFLVARGQLTRSALERALDAANLSGTSLGFTLVSEKLLAEADVVSALRDQQMLRLIDVCAWDSGTFTYLDGQRFVGEKFDLELDAAALLVRAAREMPESILTDRLRPHMARSAGFTGSAHPFVLSAHELTIVSELDGSKTPQIIVDRYSARPEQRRAALMVIYLGYEAGLLSLRDAG